MGQIKKPIAKRIHSIKSWLDKAEQSYEQEAAMKGELQLMLARAELQRLDEDRVRETHKYSRWLVICLAIFMAACAWMYYDTAMVTPSKVMQSEDVTSPEKKVETKAITVPTAGMGETLSGESYKTEQSVVTKTATPYREPLNESGASSVTEPVSTSAMIKENGSSSDIISSNDIQQAVRDGGKVLRGQ